jgi:SM-20-related protein
MIYAVQQFTLGGGREEARYDTSLADVHVSPARQQRSVIPREADITGHSEPKMEISEKTIAVTLLLAGGHQRRVKLDAADTTLLSLLEVIAKRGDEKTKATVFNLEMDDGGGSLFFAASDLIALSTSPPVSIDLQIENKKIEFSRVIKENYFPSEVVAALLKHVERNSAKFKPSKVIDTIKAIDVRRKERRSLVLKDLADFESMFCERILSELPATLAALQIPSFRISEIELQITSHNDGHYFQRHRDSGVTVCSRIVTFVYYFYNEPRAFEGGQLRLFNGTLENESYSCGEVAVDLNPTSNTMVYFPSACYHEVLPVKCSSGKFRDSRFTVNGCVRMEE